MEIKSVTWNYCQEALNGRLKSAEWDLQFNPNERTPCEVHLLEVAMISDYDGWHGN